MRHELHLVRRGLTVLALVLPALVAVGAVAGGRNGALSVLLGAGIVAANQAVAGLSTGWARTLAPGVLAVGYGVFALRMVAVLTCFTWAAGLGWVDRTLVAIAFCAALVVTLTAECLAYVRKSYVPTWRMVS